MHFLSHPLMLLVAGSILSSLLAWQWQNRQKRNEIRVDLVSEMSETVMSLVAILKAARRDPEIGVVATPPGGTPSVDGAARQFDIDRCIIGTKLEAHLMPGAAAPRQWDALGDGLIVLHDGLRADPSTWPDYQRRVANLLDEVEAIAADSDGPAASLEPAGQREPPRLTDWEGAMDTLLRVKIGVIRATKRTRMPAFELRAVLPGLRPRESETST